MDILIISICCGVAVWYLYRKFSQSIQSDPASCGCAGCDACAIKPECDTER